MPSRFLAMMASSEDSTIAARYACASSTSHRPCALDRLRSSSASFSLCEPVPEVAQEATTALVIDGVGSLTKSIAVCAMALAWHCERDPPCGDTSSMKGGVHGQCVSELLSKSQSRASRGYRACLRADRGQWPSPHERMLRDPSPRFARGRRGLRPSHVTCRPVIAQGDKLYGAGDARPSIQRTRLRRLGQACATPA